MQFLSFLLLISATIRIRTNDYRTNRGTNNRTNRKYTNTRCRKDSTVTRRTSTAGDVQVSMLPDLSEMRANEQTAWEEVMQLKALPIPMCQKKEMKAKILVSGYGSIFESLKNDFFFEFKTQVFRRNKLLHLRSYIKSIFI